MGENSDKAWEKRARGKEPAMDERGADRSIGCRSYVSVLGLWFLLFVWLIPLPAQQAVEPSVSGMLVDELGPDHPVFSLEGSWLLRFAKEGSDPFPEFSTLQGWHFVQVPGQWREQGFPYKGKYAWYRKAVIFPVTAMYQNIVFVIGRVGDVDEVYLDGNLIGKTGSFPPYLNIDRNKRRVYHVPSGFIAPGNVQYITVKVYNHNSGGGIISGPVHFTLFDESLTDLLLEENGKLLISAILIIVALFLSYYYIRRPNLREIFFLMVSATLYAIWLLVSSHLLNFLAGSEFIRLKILTLVQFFLPLFLLGFFQLFWEKNLPTWYWLHIAPVLLLMFLLVLTERYEFVLIIHEQIFYGYSALAGLEILIRQVRIHKSAKKESQVVWLLEGILLLAFVNDYIKSHFFWHLTALMPYGFAFFFIGLTFLLISRLFRKYQQIEQDHYQLENRFLQNTSNYNMRKMLLQQEIDLAYHLKKRMMEVKSYGHSFFRAVFFHNTVWSIGRDYFTHFQVTGGKTVIFLCDLDQTGPPATLAAAWFQYNLDRVTRRRFSPMRLFEEFTLLFQSHNPSKNLHAVVALLDSKSRSLQVLNAGMPAPVYYTAREAAFSSVWKEEKRQKNVGQSGAQPVSSIKSPSFYEKEIKMEKGDRICLYSYGIENSTGMADNIPFGRNRVEDFFKATRKVSANDLGELLFAELRVFQDQKQQSEDWSLVVLEAI